MLLLLENSQTYIFESQSKAVILGQSVFAEHYRDVNVQIVNSVSSRGQYCMDTGISSIQTNYAVRRFVAQHNL